MARLCRRVAQPGHVIARKAFLGQNADHRHLLAACGAPCSIEHLNAVQFQMITQSVYILAHLARKES
jgi:hypothetical protein